MAVKQLAYSTRARARMRRGVRQLADAVRVTLGPCGRNVLFTKGSRSALITHDGATVANQIELPSPSENVRAEMVERVATKTAKDVGDGIALQAGTTIDEFS